MAFAAFATRTARVARRGLSSCGFRNLTGGTETTVAGFPVRVFNEGGSSRVVVTKPLPGDRWLDILQHAGCRVEVCESPKTILSVGDIAALIGPQCDGVIGQLTEDWSAPLFGTLKRAGGRAFSTYAVGYNNVKVHDATNLGIPVGNTPGVLTDTTAEIAAALALAAARRVVEADKFMRAGNYEGWLPTLFVGSLLQGKTCGIVGAGRIGFSFAKMLVEGHKMDLVYYDLFPQPKLEQYFSAYGEFLKAQGERPVTVRRLETVEAVLREADLVSLHCALDASTHHLIDAAHLRLMKPDAVLVNAARGEVIDEAALVAHLETHPDFRAGLDVYEHEPRMAAGLAECDNAVVVPHIASASLYTRGGMATLAAANVAAVLRGFPAWRDPSDVAPFLEGDVAAMPPAAPSIVNAADLGLALYAP